MDHGHLASGEEDFLKTHCKGCSNFESNGLDKDCRHLNTCILKELKRMNSTTLDKDQWPLNS